MILLFLEEDDVVYFCKNFKGIYIVYIGVKWKEKWISYYIFFVVVFCYIYFVYYKDNKIYVLIFFFKNKVFLYMGKYL